MYDEVFDEIVKMIKNSAVFPVYVGGNPPKESIAVTGFTTPTTTYRDRDTAQTYDVTINGKSEDQEKIFRALCTIHQNLTLRKTFPHAQKWQITSIDTTASPRLLGVEDAERNRYLYGSSIKVKFYALGVKGE